MLLLDDCSVVLLLDVLLEDDGNGNVTLEKG